MVPCFFLLGVDMVGEPIKISITLFLEGGWLKAACDLGQGLSSLGY